jgi:hypothetical protein
MTLRLSKYFFAILLLSLSGLASAGVRAIDIFTVDGVPGTGGYTYITGPCYCTEKAFISPVMLLQPGIYDFGKLRDYWVPSGATPDAGPYQPDLYLLFSPIEITSIYPDDFPQDFSTVPAFALCDQGDSACNASFQNASVDMDLGVTLPLGENAVQIVLIGNYQYTPPAPEPYTFCMFIFGLLLIAGIARKRGLPE